MNLNCFLIVSVLTFTAAAHPAIINVPDPVNGIFSIQDGIDAAVDGDEVVVRPVEWFETINLSGKAITLRSIDPTTPVIVMATIINGTGQSGPVVTCNSGEGPGTVISGFVITSGSGGMLNDGSSPTVTNCTFSRNTTNSGGGMANLNLSSPTLTNCLFIRNTSTGNTATRGGGGMYNNNDSSPTLQNCTFAINTALIQGGGIFNDNMSSPNAD